MQKHLRASNAPSVCSLMGLNIDTNQRNATPATDE
jgi:hypothetical protein